MYSKTLRVFQCKHILSNRLLSLPCILLRNLMFDIWKLETYTAQGLGTLIHAREIVLSSTHTIVSYDEERISKISLIKKTCLCFWYQCSGIYFPECCAIIGVLIEKKCLADLPLWQFRFEFSNRYAEFLTGFYIQNK